MAAIAAAVLIIPSAFAVHDQPTGLQLDGNVNHSCPPAADNTTTCTATPNQQDWADLFHVSDTGGPPATTETVTTNTSVVGPTGSDPDFTAATFTRDFGLGSSCSLTAATGSFCTGDSTTFATGSKDTLDITGGGWQCNHDNNVNSKIDIMNTYAATYTVPSGSPAETPGDKILYFAMEKNKNNGTNDVGFWFLQGDANCSAPSGHQNFTGSAHHVGDILVVSEFSSGGGVSSIFAYKWVGGSNPLVQIAAATGGASDCKTALASDSICATTNSGTLPYNGNISTPWLTSDATLGVGHTVVPPNFFEGGIDLTQAFKNSGGGTAPSCFNTFIGDTRSSTSLTATLFDYARGKIGNCGSSTVTHPQDSTGTNITSDLSIGANAAVQVRDHADITVSGFSGSFAGTVTFYLCGPLALSSTSNCNNTDTAGPPPVVDTGGVQIGSPVTVNGSNGSASVNSSDPGGVSGKTVLTSVGRYCWRAVYSGDGDIPGSTDPDTTSTSGSECFSVQPLKASLSTSASCTKLDGTNCVINNDTLSDTATIGNTANQPGTNGIGAATAFSAAGTIDATNQAAADNSITWTLKFGASCTAVTRFGSVTRQVSGNGVYPMTPTQSAVSYSPSTSATPADSVGLYTFVASYPGNGPNTTAADSTACPDTSHTEEVTIIGSATSSSKQGWLPNDRITLGSTPTGLALSGNLTVSLYYGALGNAATLANCTVPGATLEYQETWSNAAGANHPAISGTAPITVNTHNTSFFVGIDPSTGNPSTPAGLDTDATHSYFWLIHYADNSLTSPNDRCEKTVITHDDGS